MIAFNQTRNIGGRSAGLVFSQFADHPCRSDGLIVNFGKPEYVGQPPQDPRRLDGWHCDGDVSGLGFSDHPAGFC